MSRLDFPLPPPWVRALLVVVFLGFGVLLGSTISSPSSSAGGVRQLRLVLPQAATPNTGTSTAQATPPPVTSETTPESSSTTPPSSSATNPTATSTPSASHTHGSHGGESSPSANQGAGAGEGSSGSGANGAGSSKLPAVKHVFLIMLADQPYASVFGPASKATYLSHTLEKRGELLVRYYAVAHDELASEIALLSGQGPTAQTAVNCPTFSEVAPAGSGADEQVNGNGCVYPASTQTLMGQLAAKHLGWKAYIEGMEGAGGAGAAGAAATCVHPTLGAADGTVAAPASTPAAATGPPSQWPAADVAAPGASYTTFRNPFVYFHSIITAPDCGADDVGLGRLAGDLAKPRHAPAFSYIAPSPCDDGAGTPCAPGHAAGVPAADAFLQKVVPEILASRAYKQGGLLIITVDQAPSTGIEADSSSCCGQPSYAALPAPASSAPGSKLPPSGGGQVGALLISRFVKAGTINGQEPFNGFSLLRTLEDLFGLKHIGYAAAKGVSSFGAEVFDG